MTDESISANLDTAVRYSNELADILTIANAYEWYIQDGKS
jgi:hypothetical protein